MARAWPPAPKVASTYVPSGRIARPSSASAAMTGTWGAVRSADMKPAGSAAINRDRSRFQMPSPELGPV